MLAGNTTEIPHYYKKLTSQLFLPDSENQSFPIGLITDEVWMTGYPPEGVGRKLIFYPIPLVKMSFPFHNQTKPRPH